MAEQDKQYLNSKTPTKKLNRAAMGAASLMAMAAVGPGFLTQTGNFTGKFGADFGFAILICIIADIIVQLNIWRIIVVSGKRAQVIANEVVPGFGYLLSALVAIGGFIFNIGNIGGAGMGLNILFGISPQNGAIIAALIIGGILISKNALKSMDTTVQILAVIKVAILVYILAVATVPYQPAIKHTFMPTNVDFYSIIAIVGGTVGGYISFSGGHRLLSSGAKGSKDIKYVHRGALTGIGIASVIRIMLFLAGLAVVTAGIQLNPSNPTATIFQETAGTFGYKFFGLLLLASGASSTLGSTFTSTSFLDYATYNKGQNRFSKNKNWFIIAFIAVSTLIFYFVGNPVKILIFAGALNGFILPIALAILLIGAHKTKIMSDQNYHHPLWLTITGWIIVLFMAFSSIKAVIELLG